MRELWHSQSWLCFSVKLGESQIISRSGIEGHLLGANGGDCGGNRPWAVASVGRIRFIENYTIIYSLSYLAEDREKSTARIGCATGSEARRGTQPGLAVLLKRTEGWGHYPVKTRWADALGSSERE